MALNADQLNTIYQNVLFRNVDTAGIQFFANRTDISDAQVRQQIELSPEASTFVSPIVRLYQEVLGRVPDAAGLRFFSNQLRTGTSLDNVAQQLVNSAEFSAKSTAVSGAIDATDLSNTNQLVSDAFQSILGRTPASSEFAFFQGRTPAQILSLVAGSPEAASTNAAGVVTFLDSVAQGTYPTGTLNNQTGGNGGGTNAGQTFALTTGNDSFAGTGANDTFRADNTTLQVTDTIRGNGGNDTFSYIDNSTTGTAPVAASINGVANINIRNLSGTPGTQPVSEVAQVTFAPQTIAATNGAPANTVTITLAGRTLTLTGATDNATTTTFTAEQIATAFNGGTVAGAATSGTLTNYTISTGDNTTALRFTSTVAGNVPDLTASGTGTVAGITVTQGQAGTSPTSATDTVAAGNFVGATSFNSELSTGVVNFTGLTSGQQVGIIGNGAFQNAGVGGTYSSGTAAVLNVSGGTAGSAGVTISGASLTSATINSTGAANTLGTVALASGVTTATINAQTNLTVSSISDSNLATLNINGAASSVSVGTLDTGVRTVTATGLAGGVTTTLNAGITSFKGGQGNDVVTAASLTSTTAGIIDAGAGTADRLNATNLTVNSATAGALYTGFEVLRNTASGQINASFVSGITSVQTAASGAGFSNLTAAQAAAVTNVADNSSATFSLTDATGTTDTLSVTLANTTATASADLTSVSISGFERLNVVSTSGNSADINALSFAAAGDLTALNLSGAAPISVDTTNITKAVAIDASGLTFVPTAGNFDLTISGNLVKGSVVTGSANADSITTTAAITGTTGEFVTYNAGGGDDSISTTVAALNNVSSSNGSVKIDGGAGVDTLTITGSTSGITDANFQYVTGVEKILFAATGALNFQSGAQFSTNFGTSGVTITDASIDNSAASTLDLGSFTGNATLALTSAASSSNTTVITGGGADNVSLTSNALTTGLVSISTGAGNDTITFNATGSNITVSGAPNITINGGLGQDTINLTIPTGKAPEVSIVINDGHSTVAAADSINGFVLGAAGPVQGMTLDFDGTSTIAAAQTNQAVSGFTASQLTYSISSTGLLTLSGTSAASITAAQEATIAQQVVTTANATVTFVNNGDTYVFHDQGANDSLVKLVGLTATTGLETNSAGANLIHLA